MGCASSKETELPISDVNLRYILFTDWRKSSIDQEAVSGDFLQTRRAAGRLFRSERPDLVAFAQKCRDLTKVAEGEGVGDLASKIIFTLRNSPSCDKISKTLMWKTLLIISCPLEEIGKEDFYSRIKRGYSEAALIEHMASIFQMDASKPLNEKVTCDQLMKSVAEAVYSCYIFNRVDDFGTNMLSSDVVKDMIELSGINHIEAGSDVNSSVERNSHLGTFEIIPPEMRCHILSLLDWPTKTTAARVCANWRSALLDTDSSLAVKKLKLKYLRILAMWTAERTCARKICNVIGFERLESWLHTFVTSGHPAKAAEDHIFFIYNKGFVGHFPDLFETSAGESDAATRLLYSFNSSTSVDQLSRTAAMEQLPVVLPLFKTPEKRQRLIALARILEITTAGRPRAAKVLSALGA
eukprot:TRINITY_DN2056_c0_g1_i1.p1 TRINITY_DN2056_c0_g1~~TRINITY_DN2056_c0_g1_i1.p1  ORF type:complete len:411 (-),score=55.38 TRINITY_DN2056_c0_g1_i1:793-2025(-)